ncbi:pleckstrin homology domain-containing family G member 5 isoform X1 [Hydra vulgaris]|uniref:pleckstrin homology domain-containing family G member 5 isoform X1 n=2 Tax=Hydra vulgaris TaxID=6087 RepID=UPI001F5F8DCB|nr:pleckstrin homology domain-containing family G member 5 [Hydra vulgaris]
MSKKDSSQKFFTLRFNDGDNGDEKTVKIPVKKGKILKESLGAIFTGQKLSFDTHSVFLDTSKTPLPQGTDTFVLGGHNLLVKENDEVDERIKNLMKEENKKSQDINKRFLDLLDRFSTYGFEDDIENKDSKNDFFLESAWNDVVDIPHSDENKRLLIQQQSIFEIFTTEVGYIKDLEIIIKIFKRCLDLLRKDGYLLEVEPYAIFANIEEIYNVNVTFWNSLKPALENARATKIAFKTNILLKAFEKFEILFQPYIEFFNEDPCNKKYLIYSEQTNLLLKQYLSWCDAHEKCMRLKLSGFLIKPLQRITKYSLLLRAVLSKTDDLNDKAMLEEMMSRVETFVSKINAAVHLRQEQEKILSILAKFDTYNPMEAVPCSDEVERLATEFCNLDLKASIPGLPSPSQRFIIKDGPMKIVDKQGKKEVQVFLFTDLLVVTKLKKKIDRYRIIRPPYRLNKIVIRDIKDSNSILFVYLNEYGVLSTAFILQTSVGEQEKWKTAVLDAKEKYQSSRMTYFNNIELLDEELPDSPIIQNLSNRKSVKPTPSVDALENKNSNEDFQWSNIKLFGIVTFICIVNIVLSKIL